MTTDIKHTPNQTASYTPGPRVGQPLFYASNHRQVPGWLHDPSGLVYVPVGTVARTEDSICHYQKVGGDHDLFIWSFKDGLNKLFKWGAA